MGTDRSRTQYEGILTMDRRITAVNAANTTATEADPAVGPVTADAGFSTEAVIVASGTPDDGDTLEILGMKAGSPGINRAGYAWRESSATDWFGWDSPNAISRFEGVENATVATTGFPYPQPIPLDDGQIVIIAGDDSTNLRGVSKRVRAVAGTYGANVQLYQETANPNNDQLHPRSILLDSGRLLVYHATMDLDNSFLQIRMMYSDAPDTDATYTLGESGVLEDAFDLISDTVNFARLRVAHSPDTGQFLLTIESVLAAVTTLTQYASRDGVFFEKVGSTIIIAPGHDIAHSGGFFMLAYQTSVGTLIRWRRIASAYAAFSSAPEVDGAVTGTTSSEEAVSLVVGDDGLVYTYGSPAANANFAVSSNHGASWQEGVINLGQRYGGAGMLMTRISGCWTRGTAVLIGNQSAPAANVLALTALFGGGYSTLTLPPVRKTKNVGAQFFWQDGWAGYNDPQASFFTNNDAGAPTVTRNTDSSYNVVCGAGDVFNADIDLAGGASYIEVMGECATDSTTGSVKLIVRSSKSAGPLETEAEIRVVGTAIQLFDSNGAQIGGSATITAGVRVEIRLAVNGRSATAWYSVVDITDHRRTWTEISTTTTLTTAAANNGNRVRYQCGNNTTAEFRRFHYAFEDETVGFNTVEFGESPAAGFTNPGDLFAKSLPSAGASWVNDSVSIKGVDGPILRGVEMTMEVTHPRPVENVLPSEQPSPRKIWRSVDATQDQTITYGIQSQAEEAHAGGDTLGIYISRCNAQNVRVETLATGGAWTTLVDIARAHTSLNYIRAGNTVYPDEANASTGFYVHRDELAGCYFVIPDGAAGDTRTIIGNSEGYWTSGPTIAEKRCVIYLDGDEMDGTETTSGTAGVVVFRDSMTTMNLKGTNEFRAYRFTLNDSAVATVFDPPGAQLECGKIVIGPMAVFGKRQDASYSITREAQVELQELTDGSTRSRKVGATRRTVTLNFDDGVDVTSTRSVVTADYVEGTSAAGGEPIAHTNDLPLMIDGLIDEIDGPHGLVVYVPNITYGPHAGGSEAKTFLTGRAGGAIYGRITGPVTQTAVLGDPMLTEVITGPSITIREEV